MSSQTIKRLEDCSMTTQEKLKIAELRAAGLGYKKIATETGISENTVKSYLKRMTAADDQKEPDQPAAVFSCPLCGKEIRQIPGRKAKRFCSDSCRYRWWNSHPNQIQRESLREFTCPVCGKTFSAYGSRNRKYCSHDCYIRDRFGGER